VLALGCAHPGARGGGDILERGGELADVVAERSVVTVNSSTVAVLGLTEVPEGSRWQMALAGVDAITRSELLKAVQVRVSSVEADVESTDPAQRSIAIETVEAVDGVLAHAGPMTHGWARVRRGDEIVVRLWARLEVPRVTVEGAVRAVLERRGKGSAAAIVEGLSTPPPTGSSRP
jgi:hypothetical protein